MPKHADVRCRIGFQIAPRCPNRATDFWLVCSDHWWRDCDEQGRAIRYAVGSILYYGSDASLWPDWEFDALCEVLLRERTFERVRFLEESMLRAGSGYDLTKFDGWLHDLAAEHLPRANSN